MRQRASLISPILPRTHGHSTHGHSALALSALALSALAFGSCASFAKDEVCPLAGGRPADELIQADEVHFKHLWMLTDGGENAEGYFSFDSKRLVLQARDTDLGIDCDRIYVTDRHGGPPVQISNGAGVTTCGYFLPGDESVVFASTQLHHEQCPPPPDRSQGYVWPVHPEYDLWVQDLASGAERRLTSEWGYDAEATISPLGDRMVFTSTRSGDLELWTCDLEGKDLFQVTDALGYDGGAFFSHDGQWLVFRSTAFDSANLESEHARYREDLERWSVRPAHMEIMLIRPNGSGRKQVTRLGGANFAPFFFPDGERILFSSNHHSSQVRGPMNFDLFAIGTDGQDLERVTTYEGFDSFPMFSPSGRYLVFASNRGNSEPGETNLFLAEWRD